jgi:hypothetical protein
LLDRWRTFQPQRPLIILDQEVSTQDGPQKALIPRDIGTANHFFLKSEKEKIHWFIEATHVCTFATIEQGKSRRADQSCIIPMGMMSVSA